MMTTTSETEPTIPEIVEALADRIEQLAQQLLPGGFFDHSRDEWAVADLTGRKPKNDGSLRVSLSGEHKGQWRDWATGERGDPLDLIEGVERLTTHDAALWAQRWLGSTKEISLASSRSRCGGTTPDSNSVARIECARAIWREAQPAAGTKVETYLRTRAITLSVPPSIRFHPNLKHERTGLYFPTMIAGVQTPDREITAVLRTYLLPDGRGKAGISKPKMALGPIGAGAVRLAKAGPVLGLAEGIETALSAMQLFNVPCWVAVGSRMYQIELPEIVRHVVIYADNGDAGLQAANKAIETFTNSRKVTLRLPPDDYPDWNDALQALRQEQVA